MATKVGIIGIGNIGLPVAQNLLKAGFEVIGFSLDNMDKFAAAGGKAAGSAREVAQAVEIIVDCLPKEKVFEAVMTGKDGIADVMRPGQIVASLSTYPLQVKTRQRDALAKRGILLLDCEISGTPPMVAQRKGVVFISGDKAAADKCMPVFNGFADLAFHLGEFGTASKMKIVANHLVAVNNLAVAEALALGTKAGLDPETIIKVVGPGAGGSAMFNIRAPMMASRKFTPAPGPLNTLEKYIHLVQELAQQVGCVTPLMDTAAKYYEQAISSGRGEQDIAAMFEVIESARR
jgi:3-hydroxyisobutyrate dehydrogenase-like beta-hydroxyacid dehydrogenase